MKQKDKQTWGGVYGSIEERKVAKLEEELDDIRRRGKIANGSLWVGLEYF